MVILQIAGPQVLNFEPYPYDYPFQAATFRMSGVVSGEKRAEVRVAFCHFTRREGSVAFTNGHNHGSLTTACYNHKIKRPSVMITATF